MSTGKEHKNWSESLDIYNPDSQIDVERNNKSTGDEYLDTVLGGGYEPKTLIVLQGRAKIGKSTMMSNMAVRAALLGNNVGIYTVELGAQKYAKRVGSNLFNIPSAEYSKHPDIIPSAIKRFREQYPDAGEIDITESLTGATEVSDIEKHYIEWESSHGKKLDVIFVDNLNLLHADESLDWNMYLYVKRICEDLRKIAQKNNWCVVTAAVTKHGVFNDDMDMYSCAESSAIATVADSFFGLMGQPGSPYFRMKCLSNRDGGYMNSYANYVKDMNFFRINEDSADYMNLGEEAIINAENYQKFSEAPSQTYNDFRYRVMHIAAKHEEPHVVKNTFLHSDKQAKIIKEMYGDSFDSISTNRDKYLTFLQRVEEDGRISELDDILKRYVK